MYPLVNYFKRFYNQDMVAEQVVNKYVEQRADKRFDDIGRIEAEDLCPLAGVLDNISLNGCKVHYKFPVSVDMENDYKVKITFARDASNGSLSLLCRPRWTKETNGRMEIGFSILPSVDSARLTEYVKKLGLEENGKEFSEEIGGSDCQLI